MKLAFLPMGEPNSGILIFTNITFEYGLIIRILTMSRFAVHSKTMNFN